MLRSDQLVQGSRIARRPGCSVCFLRTEVRESLTIRGVGAWRCGIVEVVVVLCLACEGRSIICQQSNDSFDVVEMHVG